MDEKKNAGYETILVEQEGSVVTVTINRAEFGNAFAEITYYEIARAIEGLGNDESVRAIVLTGAGKNFCAGGDITDFKQRIEDGRFIAAKDVDAPSRMADQVRRCPKPVIAMINGAAAGAGCSLALACDFRVMSPKSKLMTAFINMGLSGDTGGIYFLYRMVGIARLTELMALGTAIGAEEALKLGLTNRVSDTVESLRETTCALARELAEKPTAAIACQKRLYYEFFYRDLGQFNLREGDYMQETSRTEDFSEAVHAFLEKRKPVFTGK